uniref:Reverse transcriptase domain-containing protein n=1 Tax=Tanacetum cinerariifolium TaxID=118510 RepID=A0A6L2MJH1_TANCI|nr:reverse transcriptase domain-containing protein [Tanacetum cinerariifolium]
MQEVVKKEIVKLLNTDIIYPITDSPWVSPIHCVPKKGGITIVTNENDKLTPTRTVTGWRVCIDYRKLNEAIAKDHFHLPFMDQMLERLAGNKYFCFLDGFSGNFQIPINPMDQEKTTFTCLFSTYTYRRMPFGLCNALATFQSACWQSFTIRLKNPLNVAKMLILSLIEKYVTSWPKKELCLDTRHYVSGPETQTILDECHQGPINGHYKPNVTAKKVLDSGFYWPTTIKESHTLVRLCKACQKMENISKRDEMPLTNIQENDDEWLMAPVTPSRAIVTFSSTYEVRGPSTTTPGTLLLLGQPFPGMTSGTSILPSVIDDLCMRMGNLEYEHGALLRARLAKMESREATFMSYMLWVEERFTALEKKLPGRALVDLLFAHL